MKSLILALTCLISLSSIACPDISGEFLSCKVISGGFYDQPSYVITQEKINGLTKFHLIKQSSSEDSNEWLVADGKTYSEEYTIRGTESQGLAIHSTICSGSKVITKAIHKVSGVEMPYTFTRKFEKKGSQLVIESIDNIYGKESRTKYVCE
jgi:hypothetical protein